MIAPRYSPLQQHGGTERVGTLLMQELIGRVHAVIPQIGKGCHLSTTTLRQYSTNVL
jgi:hypothetical protein